MIMSFSFSRGSKGNSGAWWSTGVVENGDRSTGANGK